MCLISSPPGVQKEGGGAGINRSAISGDPPRLGPPRGERLLCGAEPRGICKVRFYEPAASRGVLPPSYYKPTLLSSYGGAADISPACRASGVKGKLPLGTDPAWFFRTSDFAVFLLSQPTAGTRGCTRSMRPERSLGRGPVGPPPTHTQVGDTAQQGRVFATMVLTGPSVRAGVCLWAKAVSWKGEVGPNQDMPRRVWGSIPSAPGPLSLALGRAWPGGGSGPARGAGLRHSRAAGAGQQDLGALAGAWRGPGLTSSTSSTRAARGSDVQFFSDADNTGVSPCPALLICSSFE